MSCLFAATLPFRCEVWIEQSVQDVDTGQFLRVWELDQTVNCGVEPATTSGKSSASTEEYSNRFKYDQYIYITTSQSIAESSRITNIKTISGTAVFLEPEGNPTIFEIVGKNPEIESVFGNILGYKMLCNRSEVQEMTNA